jgi:hypothetical protein
MGTKIDIDDIRRYIPELADNVQDFLPHRTIVR